MDKKELLSMVDHTRLTPTATWGEIKVLCDEGIEYGVASVCIPPSYIEQAREYVGTRLALCTVIGFPNGYSTTEVKAFEARDAIANGADEIDMVANLGWIKDGQYDLVREEIAKVKAACGDKLLKVIVETCLLTTEEKIAMCGAVTAAGADFIKTSTGFSTGGATKEDIELFAAQVGKGVRIKAAGGIATLEDAESFAALGATRLGTSRVVQLMKNQQGSGY